MEARVERCIAATREVMGESAARDICMHAIVGSRRRIGEKTRRQNRSSSNRRRNRTVRRRVKNTN
jgi:hypothetical protein